MTISERIFWLLEERNLTQKELSDYTGIKPNTISSWKAHGTNPTSEKIERICEFFNITYEWLLTGKGKMNCSLQTNEPPLDDVHNVIANISQSDFTEDEMMMIDDYRVLTKVGQMKAQRTMCELKSEYKKPQGNLSASEYESEISDELTQTAEKRTG